MKQCPICDTAYPDENTTCSTDGALLIEIREWVPGSIIRNKYRILGKVGQGGMGLVYKAEHMVLEEVRALKVMNPNLAADQRFVRRFRQEAQAARRLQHTNVVHVDDCEQADDGSLFIAMDYIEGVTLRQLLRATKGPLPVSRALGIARGVADALAAADGLGMVHRDIKPENILIARDRHGRDVPKVTDFGIAAMRESAVVSSTRPLLTPAYASPEQWRGLKTNELDGRTDLYALGITLYEMLAGGLPFHAHTDEGWMRAHLDEIPAPPSQQNPALAQVPGLDALVLKLISKNRDDRPLNGLVFIQELNIVEAQSTWDQPTMPARRSPEFAAPTPSLTPAPSAVPTLSQASGSDVVDLRPSQLSTDAASAYPSASPESRFSEGRQPQLPSRPVPAQARSQGKLIKLVLIPASLVLLIVLVSVFGPRRRSAPSSTVSPPSQPVVQSGQNGESPSSAKSPASVGNDSAKTALPEAYLRSHPPASSSAVLPKQTAAAVQENQTGDNYFYGRGVPVDYAESLNWYRKAADQGDPQGQYNVGWMNLYGHGTPQNNEEAYKWYRKAADQGYSLAQNDLGSMYQNGRMGLAKNEAMALALYRKAADQGLAVAQNNLGMMYQGGLGVPRNPGEAAKWYRKAADQGYAGAQSNLGLLYNDGEGVPQNPREAAKWYRKAADQGYAFAQAELGALYQEGRGVPQDLGEAAKWFRKAADQGDAAAQTRLGYMYYAGQGVPQNLVEALKLYRQAADQGAQPAQYGLGLAFKTGGPGVPKDDVEAYKWLFMVRSDPDAAKELVELQGRMTAAQIAEAEHRANEWQAQHSPSPK